MRDALIEALRRLQRGDEDAPEAIVDLFLPRVGDPRDNKQIDLDVQKNYQ